MSAPLAPEYIGDGIYAQEGRFAGEVIITTGSHELEHADNIIFVDPVFVGRLTNYMAKVLTGEHRPSTEE